MPAVSPTEHMLLHVSNAPAAHIVALGKPGKYPFPLAPMMKQAVSDRLTLAGAHLRAGDQFIFILQFRAAISRHYYAMYHSARAVTFADTKGDDHQRHSILPRHLPSTITNVAQLEVELTDARLLRNEADYDPYPIKPPDWELDARRLAVIAASFVLTCEDFALMNGHI